MVQFSDGHEWCSVERENCFLNDFIHLDRFYSIIQTKHRTEWKNKYAAPKCVGPWLADFFEHSQMRRRAYQ